MLGIVAALAAAGMTYEHVAASRDRTTLSRIGRAVDIGGRSLKHLLFRVGKTSSNSR